MPLTEHQKFHELVEANNIAIWEWDIATSETVFNHHWAQMIGYEVAELLPLTFDTWRHAIHPEDLQSALKAIEDHFAGKTDFYDTEARMKHKKGHWVWIRMRGRIVQRDSTGAPLLMFGTHDDITSTKQAQFAEQQHKHTYDLLVRTGDLANIGTWEVTMPPTAPRWDAVTRRIHQVDPDFSCDTERAIEFYKEGSSRERIAIHFTAAVTEGITFDEEFEIVTAKGELRWVRSIGIPEFSGGQCMRVYGLFQDITEQKSAFDALQQLTSTLNNVMNAASEVAIIATDCQGIITLFNRGAESMLGYQGADLIGHVTPMLFHLPDEVAARGIELTDMLQRPITGFDIFTSIAQRDGKESRRWTYRTKDGTNLSVQLMVTPMFDLQQEVIGFLGIARDITLQEHMSFELQQFFGLSQNIMCIIGKEGHFERVNQATHRILGYEQHELLLQPYIHFVHPDDLQATQQEIAALKAGSPSLGFINRLRCRDERYVHLEWFTTPDPVTGKLYATAQDITERKRLDEMKSEFVATVSHELRTPLTSISGALALVLSGRLGLLTDKNQQLLKIANDSSQRLTLLINDLLDIEKLNAGKIQLELQHCPVQQLLAQAVAEHRTYAHEKQVVIDNLAANLATDALIFVDRFRFLQIMANLLSNAIKFSPAKGLVQLNVTVTELQVCISISDQGPGISEDFKQRIFQKFSQAESGNTRAKGGTGLGLSITKELVQAMAGEIAFESTHGHGATFYLRFNTNQPTTD